jgi:hypothetical protein
MELSIAVFFSACSPHIATSVSKKYPALDNSAKVKVVNTGESIPFKYIELGSIRLGDAGMTGKSKCTYEALLALAMEEAKKTGGDAIKIVEHIPPHIERYGFSIVYHQCHSLFVLILKTEEIVE